MEVYIKSFFKLFNVLVECGIFGAVIALCTLSSKEPFKYHIIGDMNTYFNQAPTNPIYDEKICICNNSAFDHACTNNNLIQGCFNISSNIFNFNPSSLRKLDSKSFCKDMKESFSRNKGKQLSFIFNLRYQTIRKINYALIVVIISLIFLSVADFYFYLKIEDYGDKMFIIYGIVRLLKFLTWIAKFVLFLLLFSKDVILPFL